VSPIPVKLFCYFLILFMNRAHLAISPLSWFSSPERYSISYCFPIVISGFFLLTRPLCTLGTTGSTFNSAASFTTILEAWLFILFSLWTVHQVVVWGYITVSPFYSLLLAAHLPFTKACGFGSFLISFVTVLVSWGVVPIWRVDALEILLLIFSPEFVCHVYGIGIHMVNLFLLFLANTLVRVSLK
jgi:hypothetical protein